MDRSPAPAGFASPLRSLRLTTAATDIVAGPPPVAVFSKPNALVTDTTPGGFNRGRIFPPLEGVVVRTQININLGCKRITASPARLPRAAVAFRVMEPTQGQAARIVITAMSVARRKRAHRYGHHRKSTAGRTRFGSTHRVCRTQTAAPMRRDEREMIAAGAGLGLPCGWHQLVLHIHNGLNARSCRWECPHETGRLTPV
jgi:hypothetical protein